jgi:hypothetical protein
VGVEVKDGDRPVHRVLHTQQGQGDRVVATQGEQGASGRGQLAGRRSDGVEGTRDVERVDADVAPIGDRPPTEGEDVLGGVVRAQQSGGLPDVRRAEARAGPVADAGVERNAPYDGVGVRQVRQAGQPGERAVSGEPRHHRGVDRSAGFRSWVLEGRAAAHAALPSRSRTVRVT